MLLRAIARDLGVTAPALYAHFSSRDDLLRAIAEDGFFALIDATQVTADRAIERVRLRALAYVRFASEHPELFRLMFLFRPAAVELVNDEGVTVDNELNAATEAFEQGAADLALAIADGDLAPREVNEIAMILWASTHGVATIALTAPAIAESIAADVVDTMLAGLAP